MPRINPITGAIEQTPEERAMQGNIPYARQQPLAPLSPAGRERMARARITNTPPLNPKTGLPYGVFQNAMAKNLLRGVSEQHASQAGLENRATPLPLVGRGIVDRAQVPSREEGISPERKAAVAQFLIGRGRTTGIGGGV